MQQKRKTHFISIIFLITATTLFPRTPPSWEFAAKIPLVINTATLPDNASLIGVASGGGLAASLFFTEHFALEGRAIITYEHRALRNAAYAKDGVFESRYLRYGIFPKLTLNRIFLASGITMALCYKGVYRTAGVTNEYSADQTGHDFYATLFAGYAFPVTEHLTIPVELSFSYALTIENVRAFEVGIGVGIAIGKEMGGAE